MTAPGPTNVRKDAEARYRAAQRLVKKLEAEWRRLGEPLTAEGGATGRAAVIHPLVIEIRAARRDAEKFGKELRPAHDGPRAKAVVSATIGESPAAKLRSVR